MQRFLHYFFKYTVVWHKIFKDAAENNHEGDEDFDNNFFTEEHRTFYDEKVYNHFVISFGFVLLIQGITLLIFIIVKVIYGMKAKKVFAENFNSLTEEEKQKALKSKQFWECVNNHFDMKLVFTVFLMFIIETIVFAVYNLYNESFDYDHPLFVFSVILAIIWLVIIFLMWVWDFIVPFRANEVLLSSPTKPRWGFIYTGLRLTIPRKIFQGFQYLHYAVFAVVLVCFYDQR